MIQWLLSFRVDGRAAAMRGTDHSVLSKNRDRLLEGDIAAKFLAPFWRSPSKAAAVNGPLLFRSHADRS